MLNIPLVSTEKLHISIGQRIDRMPRRAPKTPKVPITFNLPPRLREISEEWARANDHSLSTLVEYLLRRELEKNGVNPNIPADTFIKMISEKFGLSAEQMRALRLLPDNEVSAEL